MNLADYFRAPPRGAVRLQRFGASAAEPETGESAGLLALVDDLNRATLEALSSRDFPPAFLCTFVRGSTVQSRLHVASFRWQQLVRQFELEGVFEELEERCGVERTAELVLRLRRQVLAKVLRHEDRLGPAKFVVRLKEPDDDFVDRVDLDEVIRFARALSEAGEVADTTMASLFAEVRLERGARSARSRWSVWMSRRHRESSRDAWLGVFDEVVRRLEREKCLHPCLPVPDRVVALVASILETSVESARDAIDLLHFAWISVLEGPEDLSDLSVKCVVVLGRVSHAREVMVASMTDLLRDVARTFHGAVTAHAGLREFHAAYPLIEIGDMTECVGVNGRLFDALRHGERAESFLRFLTAHRMGGTYLKTFVKGVGRASGNPLDRDEVRSASDSIIHVLCKQSTFGRAPVVAKAVEPQGLSPKRVLRSLSKVLEEGESRELTRVGDRLGRIGRADYEGNQRGLWTFSHSVSRA